MGKAGWCGNLVWWWLGSCFCLLFRWGTLHRVLLWAKWHKDKTHAQETDKDTTPAGGERTAQTGLRFIFIKPPGQNSIAWLSLFSIAHAHKCYRTAEGSEILAYCRVCPEPFLPSYHRKGMFPRLQGTIKLKAVSSLLGRTSCLQACSAQAESPICRLISTFPIVATLTSFT